MDTNDDQGIALISVVLMVLFLSLLIGSISKYYIGAESKAVEESLLKIRQYWASVAGWERYRARVTPVGNYTWNGGGNDLVNYTPAALSISYEAGSAAEETFNIGSGASVNGVATFETKLLGTDCLGTIDFKSGKTVLFPQITVGALYTDYNAQFENQVSAGTHPRLNVRFCAWIENDVIKDLTVTGWRYANTDMFQ